MSSFDNYRSVYDISSNDITEADVSGLVNDLGNKLSKSGDTLAGDLDCAYTYRLKNVPNPSSTYDLANKNYVDSCCSSSISFNGIISNNIGPQLTIVNPIVGQDSIRFNNPTSNVNYRIGTGIVNSTDFSIYNEATTSNVITCNSSNNVGINNSSPSSALDVVGQTKISTSAGTIPLLVQSTSSNTPSAIQMLNTVAGGAQSWYLRVDGSSNSAFGISPFSGSKPSLYLSSNGCAIGDSTNNGSYFQVRTPSTTTYTLGTYINYFSVKYGSTTDGTTLLGLFVNNTCVGTQNNLIAKALCISPNYQMSAGSVSKLYGIHVQNPSSSFGTLETYYGLYIDELSLTATNKYAAALMGNVGINTDSPSYSLDVSGTARISNNSNQLLLQSTVSNTPISLMLQNSDSSIPVSESWTIRNDGNFPSIFSISPSDSFKPSITLSRTGVSIGEPSNNGSFFKVETLISNVYTRGTYINYFNVAYADTGDDEFLGQYINNTFYGVNSNTSRIIKALVVSPNYSITNGSISKLYGIHVVNPLTSSGTLSTYYGLYIDSFTLTATNKYAAALMGKVGINTDTPNYALDVVGTVKFITNDSSAYQLLIQTSSSSGTPSISFRNTSQNSVETYSIGLTTANSKSMYLIIPTDTTKATLSMLYGLAFGSNVISSTTTSFLYMYHSNYIYNNIYYNLAGNYSGVGADTTGLLFNPTCTNAGFNNDHFRIEPNMSNTGTITNQYCLHITPGTKTGTSTVTNAYSLYIEPLSYGSNKYAAYFGGSVGINNTAPSYSLDVTGIGRYTTSNTTSNQLLIQTSNSSGNAQIQYQSTALASSEIWTAGINTLSTKSYFYISPSDSNKANLSLSANGCTISNNGNVTNGSMLAIYHGNYTAGTSYISFLGYYSSSTSPTRGLDIAASCSTTGGRNNDHVVIAPNLSATCNIGTNISLHIGTGSMGSGGTCATSYGLYAETPGYGTTKYCAVFTGAIGVNTTTPNTTYGIDVANLNCRQYSSTTWSTASDSRIKLNIETADYSLCYNNMKNIELRRFEWDSNYMPDVIDKQVVGFIAQEVETYYPKAVSQSEENGFTDFRSLDIDQIYKTMYGALKKVINDKEILEDKVTTLENKLNVLLTQLNIVL